MAETDGDAAPASSGRARPADPVRRWTWIVSAICVLLFAWYVAADRLAPWTDQARVRTFIVPIASKVSGRVISIDVALDQIVEKGDLLLQIDPRDYKLAVQKAEADLVRAGQEMGASTDAVAVAEAKLHEARTRSELARVQAARYLELEKQGVVSKADADKARAEVAKSRAQVRRAEAELSKAREELGLAGKDNPRIREAVAALDKARRDLTATRIVAPERGGVTNLLIDAGYYANVGQPLMTFVSFKDVWIQANLRENSLGHVKAGNPVDIALDVSPGKVFKGEVSSIGFAVDEASSQGGVGQLTTVKASSGWLRDAQRFPVSIKFTDNRVAGLRRVGGQADVQIYTGDNLLLNTLGAFWIRLMSLLSYVY